MPGHIGGYYPKNLLVIAIVARRLPQSSIVCMGGIMCLPTCVKHCTFYLCSQRHSFTTIWQAVGKYLQTSRHFPGKYCNCSTLQLTTAIASRFSVQNLLLLCERFHTATASSHLTTPIFCPGGHQLVSRPV